MPRFRITHEIETTITHEVEAATVAEANAIAVELTLQRAQQVHAANPDLTFDPVDDRWTEPVLIEGA